MFGRLVHLLGWILSVFRSREDLVLENLALRQQLLALHAKRPRSRLGSIDKLFWVALRSLWTGWKKSLIVVQPETVVRWHRAGFRLYWTWLSRTGPAAGRKPAPPYYQSRHDRRCGPHRRPRTGSAGCHLWLPRLPRLGLHQLGLSDANSQAGGRARGRHGQQIGRAPGRER